jgi:MFS family permease
MPLGTLSEESGVVSKVDDKLPPPPSNGGPKAWLSVLAAFILFFVAWGPATGYGAYQDYYQRDLLASYSSSIIAWIGTVNATLLVATGVLAGPLFDQGYVRHLMVLGAILLVLGQMMLSLSSQYYQIILSQGICSGIGAGLVYVPSIALVNTQFTTKRALAMGLVTSGASLGTVPLPDISTVCNL